MAMSNGVYISLLSRFATASDQVSDFNNRNTILTSLLLKHSEVISKYSFALLQFLFVCASVIKMLRLFCHYLFLISPSCGPRKGRAS